MEAVLSNYDLMYYIINIMLSANQVYPMTAFMGKTSWITSLGMVSKELHSVMSMYITGYRLDKYQLSFYNVCRDMFDISICDHYKIGKRIELLATQKSLVVTPNMDMQDVNLFCQYVKIKKMTFSPSHNVDIVQNKYLLNILAEGSLPSYILHYGNSRRISTNKFIIDYNSKTKKLTINSFIDEWMVEHFMKLPYFLNLGNITHIDIVAKNVCLPTLLSWLFPKLQLIRASVEKINYKHVLPTCNRVVLKIKQRSHCNVVTREVVYL